MNFYVTILGSGAATPTLGRHCSGQVVNINGYRMIVDCGESTQNQLRATRQKMQSFGTIFISHLHGDHMFGLPGLLSSMHLGGRIEPVEVFAPRGLKRALDVIFEVSDTHLGYPLTIHELDFDEPTEIFSNNKCKVTAIPLLHSVPCYGYRFEEVALGPSLQPGVRDRYQLTPNEIAFIKKGNDLTLADGTVIPNSQLTRPPRRPLSYAYCCDTAYTETILPAIQGVDLLCLESTFDHSRADLAEQRRHCTAYQAAQMARKAEAKKLLLTHFSARYKIIEELMDEARKVFPNVVAAQDGEVINVV